MSRAYRIKVREALKKVIRACDHVSTELELLEILPPDQMAELLAEELERRGFERRGGKLVREGKGISVTVEADTGTVTVQAEASEQVKLEADREGWVYNPDDKKAKEALRKEVRTGLEKQAERKTEELQKQVTDKLEGQLGDLRKELDQVVNRVTAEALKRKAAQIGQIKEITEDSQSGSMTIVLEV